MAVRQGTSGRDTVAAAERCPRTPAAPDQPPAGAAGLDFDPQALPARLATAARTSWSRLPETDVAAAVDGGMLAAATAGPDSGSAVAARIGQAAATTSRQDLPLDALTHVDWTAFGMVIPVLAGSPGAGASVLAAALADVLQLAGRRTILVDAADPARSGLAMAARNAGPWVRGPHPAVCIRYSWRGQAVLAQLETWLPVIAPGMVPPPRFWHLGVNLDATVVDLGHDSWRLAAHPLAGAGGWLRSGTPMPKPVLVVRASRPALHHAEQVLSRLEPWVGTGVASTPVRLVVMGAKRWPRGVAGSAGRRVAGLLSDAVFVPYVSSTAVGGVGPDISPEPLRRAVTPLLRAWGLLDGKGVRS